MSKPDYNALALKMHEAFRGKIEVVSKVPLKDRTDMSTAYTPGVAEPCRKISENKEDVYKYTAKGNLVAIVSDGTAVLGLGDIGPEAAMPVMEGKAILFKNFGNVDAFPICLGTKDVDEIVQVVKMLEPTFGGINLEDISAPRCVEIETKLKASMNIPVFHDDQHGTAVVLSAALINALKIVGKKFETIKVVINGAGSAGWAIMNILIDLGVKDIIVCDREGIIVKSDAENLWLRNKMVEKSNFEGKTGNLADAMVGADVFIGVSGPRAVSKDMVKSMGKDPIVFAMANPDPEIDPEDAKEAGARIVGTGRSDYPNQINNVLAFPGIFRGALDARASDINEAMKVAAAYAIASLVDESELEETFIIPYALDERVATAVAKAVFDAAVKSGVAKA
ncbi:NAD(P)-dependent malic enzyme [Fusibacter ferrireducens]|uniref:NAD-dependent malic enzyme n=1 Tax=Fusibacter ferrireducens TaxID=2785058 RepID=A0ABR9ZX24_9FIRM|nr:malic enzyme-like NAD(P)-binding protein [Fusibacter ferrireducens]MBF4695019.1 NAD-dependent malic enzyme [Fusibacter ferrireducens]